MSAERNQWAGVIVAAGESRRMGKLKQLLPFGDGTVIEHVSRVAHEAGLAPIVVVLGHEADRVADALPPFAQPIRNPDYREGGMFSSVCTGLAALPEVIAGAVFFVGDNCTITADVVGALLSAWEEEDRPDRRFYIPTFEGIWGHPVCLTAGLLPAILAWHGEWGLKGAMKQHADCIVEVPMSESGTRLDIDTPEDYQRALEWLREQDA